MVTNLKSASWWLFLTLVFTFHILTGTISTWHFLWPHQYDVRWDNNKFPVDPICFQDFGFKQLGCSEYHKFLKNYCTFTTSICNHYLHTSIIQLRKCIFYLFTYLFIYSFIYLFIYLFIHSFIAAFLISFWKSGYCFLFSLVNKSKLFNCPSQQLGFLALLFFSLHGLERHHTYRSNGFSSTSIRNLSFIIYRCNRARARSNMILIGGMV